jgi:hypothetical protein
MTILIAAFVLTVLQGSHSSANQAGSSACPISDDATYGFTPENPVHIGRGAMYVKARETRYLDVLRGPEGQPVRYWRVAATPQSANSLVILDQYEVRYAACRRSQHVSSSKITMSAMRACWCGSLAFSRMRCAICC